MWWQPSRFENLIIHRATEQISKYIRIVEAGFPIIRGRSYR